MLILLLFTSDGYRGANLIFSQLQWKDLTQKHTLLLARGNHFSNTIQKHLSAPEKSASVDFNIVGDVTSAAPNALIKAHGELFYLFLLLVSLMPASNGPCNVNPPVFHV